MLKLNELLYNCGISVTMYSVIVNFFYNKEWKKVFMKKTKMQSRTIKWDEILMAVEYGLIVYILLSTVVNVLNIVGVLHFTSWFMKPTFWGHSLLVLLLLQYCLINKRIKNKILENIRPYTMGISAAGIVSTGNLTLYLMLLLVVGFLLVSGFQWKCGVKRALLTAMVAALGIEVYSIALLLQDEVLSGRLSGFLGSLWPDVLCVLTISGYCVVASREPEGEALEIVHTGEERSKGKSKKVSKCRVWMGKQKEKLKTNSRTAVMCAGWIICIIAVGAFLYYLIVSEVGANVLARAGGGVYLLRDCEDTSLTLAVAEEDGTFRLSFEEYTGANNQKVRLVEDASGLYHIVFLEPECALKVETAEDGTQSVLGTAKVVSDSMEQKWVVENNNGSNYYRFIAALNGVPLCYSIIAQGEGFPQVSVKANSGGYEIFDVASTIENEFVTQSMIKYGEEFAPTILLETMLVYFGAWIWILALAISAAIFGIVYARRIIGEKLAGLNVLIFCYLLAYGAVSVILLFGAAFGVQCYSAYYELSDK